MLCVGTDQELSASKPKHNKNPLPVSGAVLLDGASQGSTLRAIADQQDGIRLSYGLDLPGYFRVTNLTPVPDMFYQTKALRPRRGLLWVDLDFLLENRSEDRIARECALAARSSGWLFVGLTAKVTQLEIFWRQFKYNAHLSKEHLVLSRTKKDARFVL